MVWLTKITTVVFAGLIYLADASVSTLALNLAEVSDGRPAPSERLFLSKTVEDLIVNVGSTISDEVIRQIFSNCLPNTLDTTVLWHRSSDANNTIPYTYIITGDISAMWLRDSTYQVNPYVPLAKDDLELRELILGIINTQAEMIQLYPYGNAYFPLKHWNSGIQLQPADASKDDYVTPFYFQNEVFEAKFELDSLASFLYLTKYYFEETGNSEFLDNTNWLNATKIVLKTMRVNQGGTIEVKNNPQYTFTRPSTNPSETLLNGVGNPAKRCGLIRSSFRPSDDATILQYLIPSNSMAVVGLRGVANVLDSKGRFPELSIELKALADEVQNAIKKYGIVNHPEFGQVYAYEVDCYGSHVFMDDANFPSLLSLPKFGYVQKNDPIYQNTRKYILSPEWNPYFADGIFPGIGSPHTGLQRPWHMAQAMQGMTSSDEDEMFHILMLLRNTTNGRGFMHESYNVDNPSDFTRSWFAWANTVFGDFILYLNNEYPAVLQRIVS